MMISASNANARVIATICCCAVLSSLILVLGLISIPRLSIKSVFRYRHIYPLAIQAVAEGKVNLKGIVTNVFELDDIQNAMDRSVNEKADIVKSVVKIC